jgi:hypothetical protein
MTRPLTAGSFVHGVENAQKCVRTTMETVRQYCLCSLPTRRNIKT